MILEDVDPAFVRARELRDELTHELRSSFNFEWSLASDDVAARAAAILVTRLRELNKENQINVEYTETNTRRENARRSVLGDVRVSDLLRDKHRQ